MGVFWTRAWCRDTIGLSQYPLVGVGKKSFFMFLEDRPRTTDSPAWRVMDRRGKRVRESQFRTVNDKESTQAGGITLVGVPGYKGE